MPMLVAFNTSLCTDPKCNTLLLSSVLSLDLLLKQKCTALVMDSLDQGLPGIARKLVDSALCLDKWKPPLDN